MYQLGNASVKPFINRQMCKKCKKCFILKENPAEIFTMFLSVSAFNISNIWYVSDYGSDGNDCQVESAPCRNLQTVLDRGTDGADIYVTSFTLSLHMVTEECLKKPRFLWFKNKKLTCCTVESNISYTISSYNERYFTTSCCK